MADKKDGNSGTPVFSNIINKVSSALGSANESVKSGVSSVSQTVSSTVSKSTSAVQEVTTAYGLVILVTVVVAIILFIIAFYLYRYMSTRLVRKLSFEIEATRVPIKANQLKVIENAELPTMDNGRRMSYSFWMYIYDLSKFSQKEKFRQVLRFGGSAAGAGSSPAIFLDGERNKLYFRFSNSENDDPFSKRIDALKSITPAVFASGGGSDEQKRAVADMKQVLDNYVMDDQNRKLTFDDAIKIDLATRGIIIEYIPLQRWVHVTVVFNETVNSGKVTVYLDAEVVDSIDNNRTHTLSFDARTIRVNYNSINPKGSGSIYVGGDTASPSGDLGFSGLVSKVRVTNYDLSAKEVKDIYIKGPVDNFAGRFGLPPYGLRSPIYRIGGDQDVSDL